MRLLFLGELPPRTVHGISYSNMLNVEFLKRHYDVDIIEEFSDLSFHERFALQKVYDFFKIILKLLFKSLKSSDYFYSVFYPTKFGIFKNIFSVYLYKLFNRKAKVVLHMHRGDFCDFYTSRKHLFLFKILKVKVNKFIVLSKSQYYNLPVENDNKVVLHNTVEEEFNFGDKNFTENQFIFVSNYIKEKGIMEVVECFSQLSSCSVVCYGNISDVDFYNKLLSKATPNTEIRGAIIGKDKFLKMFSASALILPSYNEGMPLVILEAMSLGVPVITTKVGEIESMLGTDYPFFIEARSSNSLKETVLNFIQYPNKQELSNSLKERYTKNYARKKHFEELKKIFK